MGNGEDFQDKPRKQSDSFVYFFLCVEFMDIFNLKTRKML